MRFWNSSLININKKRSLNIFHFLKSSHSFIHRSCLVGLFCCLPQRRERKRENSESCLKRLLSINLVVPVVYLMTLLMITLHLDIARQSLQTRTLDSWRTIFLKRKQKTGDLQKHKSKATHSKLIVYIDWAYTKPRKES